MTEPSDPTRRDERTPEETSTPAHPERLGPFRILADLLRDTGRTDEADQLLATADAGEAP